MSKRFRLPAAGAAAFVLLATAPAVGSAQTGASVSLDRTGTAAGEELVVTGAGWPVGTTVVIELCGREGRSGSVDCDVSNQRVAGVDGDGVFRASLEAGRPPAPCPCVVRAVDQRSPLTASAPIAVQGVPTVPIDDQPAEPHLSLSGVVLSGGSWPELFGAPPERTLRFTVKNTGSQPLHDVPVRIGVGRGRDPSGRVDIPPIAVLQPGEARVVEVPVELDVLSFGSYTATVEMRRVGERASGRATTSTYPWGLALLPVVIVQGGLLALRDRARRRILRAAGGEDDAPFKVPELGPAPMPALPAALPLPSEPATEAGNGSVDEAVELVSAEHRRAVEEVLEGVRRNAVFETAAMRVTVARMRAEAADALRRAHESSALIVSDAVDRAGEIIEQARAAVDGGPVALGEHHDAVLGVAIVALDEISAAVAEATKELERALARTGRDAVFLEDGVVARAAAVADVSDRRLDSLLALSSGEPVPT